MKRFIDFLLVLPLVLAIVFVVFAYRSGNLANWFATSTPVPTAVLGGQATKAATPTKPAAGASVIPYPTSTGAATSTASPLATNTNAITSTSAPTFIVIPPATRTAPPTRTNTPRPTATRTPPVTNTPQDTATATPVSQEMVQGIAAGNQVIRAIENYYLDNGTYPASLLDLIPTYLPGTPVTPAGQAFVYRFFDPAHPMAMEQYWLAFRVSELPNLTCTYMRRIEYWDCNYTSP